MSSSFDKPIVAVADSWTEGDEIARLYSLCVGLINGFGSASSSSPVEFGCARSEGCVIKISVIVWRAICCSASCPLLKQWRKSVRFSVAKFC